MVIPCTYEMLGYSFSDGLVSVGKNGKFGFIDKNNNIKIPITLTVVGKFSDGLAFIREKGYWGYIDKTGKIAIPCIYSLGSNFSEGLAAVCNEEGNFGYINKLGKIVIPFQYSEAGEFSNGLASVKKDGKWGVINKTGKLIIPFKYDHSPHFSKGFSKIKKNGYEGLIDTEGNEIIPPNQYTSINGPYEDETLVVKNEFGSGIINLKGEVILPLIFSEIYPFYEGVAYYIDEVGVHGYIDKEGNWTTKPYGIFDDPEK